MSRCFWCNADPEEAAKRYEGPHATWCPHYLRTAAVKDSLITDPTRKRKRLARLGKMSDALKARQQAFARAAAVARHGGSPRIAEAIERAGKLPPGPPLGPREMAELFPAKETEEWSLLEALEESFAAHCELGLDEESDLYQLIAAAIAKATT